MGASSEADGRMEDTTAQASSMAWSHTAENVSNPETSSTRSSLSRDSSQRESASKVQGYGAVLLISDVNTHHSHHQPPTEANPSPTDESIPCTTTSVTIEERCCCNILAASTNTAEILGIEAEELLDSDIFDASFSPFAEDTLDALLCACTAPQVRGQVPLLANLRLVPCKALVFVSVIEDGIVLDVEPVTGDASAILQGSLETHALVKSAVQRLHQLAGPSVPQLCQTTIEEVQRLTGYDRVMIYKFHPDGHGEVVNEVATTTTTVSSSTSPPSSPSAGGSFLGVRFPAEDFPPATRAILMGLRSRMIADVRKPPVQLVTSASLQPHSSVVLPAGMDQLRFGASDSQSLNGGVVSTLLTPIKLEHSSDSNKHVRAQYDFEQAAKDGKDASQWFRTGNPPPRSPLWGVLVCHHYSSPYHLDYEHRTAIEFVTKVFSLHLRRALEEEEEAARQKILRVQTAVCNVLKRVTSESPESSQPQIHLCDSLANALFRDRDIANMLLQLGGYGGGCAMFLGNKWHVAGNCPSTSQLDDLLKWLTSAEGVDSSMSRPRRLGLGGHWGTISLASEGYPGAEALRLFACGLLAISLVESGVSDDNNNQRGSCLLWLRPEMLRDNNRASFVEPSMTSTNPDAEAGSTCKPDTQQVKLECVPWTSVEVDGTHELRLLLQDAIKLCEEGRITNRILVAINQERLRNLDELHRVANELQSVIRTANVPIIKLSLSLKITELNPRAMELFAGRRPSIPMPSRRLSIDHSLTPEPPLGLPFSAYLEYDCAHQMEDILMRAVECGSEPDPFHVRLSPRYDGEARSCAQPSTPLPDDHWQQELLLFVQMQRDLATGRVDELVCVCRDISAQANLIREVTARGSDHEELMSSTTAALLCVDTEGRVKGWNAAMERLSGAPRLAVVGRSLLGEVLGPAGLLEWVAQGNAGAMRELSAHLLAVLGVEKLPISSSLAASQRMWSREHGSAVWTRDIGGALSSSSAVPRHSDGEDGSLHSSSFECQSAAVNVRFVRAPGRHASKKGQTLTQLDVAITCRRLLSSDGAVAGAFLFVQDLTLPKALEKAMAVQMAAQAAADAKNRHIAFLCHEIRNPVNGILASVQAIEDLVHLPSIDSEGGSDSDGETHMGGYCTQLHDLVRTTLACTAQLQRTVDGILDLKQMEEGKLEVKTCSFKVSNVLQIVLNQVSSAASEKGLTVSTEVQSAKLRNTRFQGDDIRIQQILANLCWNSVKFTQPGGSIRISVASEPCDEPENMRLLWKVIDTGEGISEEAREGLFERFYMGNNTVSKYGGTGLGLSISRTLAEMMGGRLSCTSAPGRGSTFKLELEHPIDPRSRRTSADDTIDVAPVPEQQLPVYASPPQPRGRHSARSSGTPTVSFRRIVDCESSPDESLNDTQYDALQSSSSVADAGSVGGGRGSTRLPDGWGLRVLREVVSTGTVGVLIEVTPTSAPGGTPVATKQLWGGASIGGGGIGAALAEATEDALRKLSVSNSAS